MGLQEVYLGLELAVIRPEVVALKNGHVPPTASVQQVVAVVLAPKAHVLGAQEDLEPVWKLGLEPSEDVARTVRGEVVADDDLDGEVTPLARDAPEAALDVVPLVEDGNDDADHGRLHRGCLALLHRHP